MKKLLFFICTFASIFFMTGCGSKSPLNCPSEEYVKTSLKKISNVTAVAAVTEDNDPNGNLNKSGGYTAMVYFSLDLINQDDITGSDLISKGTDAGGSVEVYKNSSDAEKRNAYLASFDGSIFASGSHTVAGTCVIRTSNELTATNQKTMESNVIAALEGRDEDIVKIGSALSYDFDNLIKYPEISYNNGTCLYYGDCYYFDLKGDCISAFLIYDISKTVRFDGSKYVTLSLDLYCDIVSVLQTSYSNNVVFKCMIYDSNKVKITENTVYGSGNLNERIRVSTTFSLDIKDVKNGVKLSFVGLNDVYTMNQ